MSIASRMSRTAIAMLTGTALVMGTVAVSGTAYAAYSADVQAKTLAPTETAQLETASAKTSNGVKMATQAARISYSRTVFKGQGTGTKAYMKVCKKLTRDGYYAKNGNQMKCNVPVAAAVRSSGVDKKFPLTTEGQYTYMKSSKKWKCLGNYKGKESALKPGDVLIRIGGKTKYVGKDGYKYTASTNHACMYIGKSIASKVYKKNLKGTDADMGKPGAKRTFVSAHMSRQNPSRRSAACMENASAAYADIKMLVFRHR